MKIVEIKKLKRLYSLKLDELVLVAEGEESDKIYVTEDTVVKFRLSKGSQYDESQINEIIKFADYSRAKNLAIYYISFKIRTASELCKYLIGHEVPEADIPRLLKELEQVGLINDEKYAESYISSKVSGGQNGPFAIRQKLLQKGLDKDLIAVKLAEIYDEEKQLKAAQKIADKQVRAKADRLTLKQLKVKISQSLVAKGFSYNIADQTLSDLNLTADEENEKDLLAAETEKVFKRLSRRYDGYDLKRRVSQSLVRKGFGWSDISDILSDYEF